MIPVVAAMISPAGVLSAPFVDNLTASPDGRVLVWKVDASGVRNLYTNAGGTMHALTRYTVDNGQDIDTPQVLANDEGVVYLHGGVQDNSAGANPNPTQEIPAPERAIFVVPIAGGDPVQVARGQRGLSFAEGRCGRVYHGARTARHRLACRERRYVYGGQARDAADSRKRQQRRVGARWKQARVHERARRSLVHCDLHAVAEKTRTSTPSPGFTLDDFAAWSPDSSRVAFVRMPGTEDRREQSTITPRSNRRMRRRRRGRSGWPMPKVATRIGSGPRAPALATRSIRRRVRRSCGG